MRRDRLRRIALRQFLEHHFDGHPVHLKIFLDQVIVEEVRVEEEWERQSVAIRRIANAVRRGAVNPARHAVEHVADIADE